MNAPAILLGLLIAGAAAAQDAPPPAPAKPGPVYEMVFDGNLDTRADAAAIKDALREAASKGAALFVLSLSGNEARMDLIHDVAAECRAGKVPVAVYLHDPSAPSVGIGQLILGLSVGPVFIQGATQVNGTPSTRMNEQAPESTPWGMINLELKDWLGAAAGKAGAPPESVELLLGPPASMWAIGIPAALTRTPPLVPSDPIVEVRDGVPTYAMPAQVLERLRLATIIWRESSIREQLKVPDGSATISIEREGGLGRAATRAENLLKEIDSWADSIDTTLDLPEPEDRSVARSTYRAAGTRAMRAIGESERAIAALELHLELYPEVLRTPAPGQTALLTKPSSYGARWKSGVQSRRDRLVKLTQKAQRFANVRD